MSDVTLETGILTSENVRNAKVLPTMHIGTLH